MDLNEIKWHWNGHTMRLVENSNVIKFNQKQFPEIIQICVTPIAFDAFRVGG